VQHRGFGHFGSVQANVKKEALCGGFDSEGRTVMIELT